jgi:hypothetical protein
MKLRKFVDREGGQLLSEVLMAQEMVQHEEIYTHEYLWRMASAVFTEAKVKEKQADYFTLTALLMYYSAFEAFINFCGYILLPEVWADERNYFKGKDSGTDAKIAKLQEKLPDFVWQKGKRPYHTIHNLKTLRDSMVHGKVQASSYETVFRGDGMHIKWKLSWNTFVSTQKAESAIQDIKAFCETLRESMRKQSDHLHLIFPAFEGPLGTSEGEGVS